MKVTVTYPETWADVKLTNYLEHTKYIKPWEKSDDYIAKTIQSSALHFCNVLPEHLNQLPASALTKISVTLSDLFKDAHKLPLVKELTIGDTVYGFIPELDNMTYGEYLDLVTYTKKDMWDNIPTIMSILYRPIVNRVGKLYTIEPYNGTPEARLELFKYVLTMDIVFGAVAFFLNLQKDLATGILNYLSQTLKETNQIEVLTALQDSLKHGTDITQLLSSLTMTLQNSTK